MDSLFYNCHCHHSESRIKLVEWRLDLGIPILLDKLSPDYLKWTVWPSACHPLPSSHSTQLQHFKFTQYMFLWSELPNTYLTLFILLVCYEASDWFQVASLTRCRWESLHSLCLSFFKMLGIVEQMTGCFFYFIIHSSGAHEIVIYAKQGELLHFSWQEHPIFLTFIILFRCISYLSIARYPIIVLPPQSVKNAW